MNRVKDILRKGKVLFLCMFVAAQIFVPQATVQAATCNHTYAGQYVTTQELYRKTHEYKNSQSGQWQLCTEITYIDVYQNKCTKCGFTPGGGYTVARTVHTACGQ